MMIRTGVILLATVAGLSAATTGYAHPHVFVDATFVPVAEGDLLVAVETRWRFDPLYSEMVMGDADTDGDGVLNDVEQAALVAVFFADLPEYDFLTRVGIDGVWHGISEADEFWVSAQDGLLSAGFTLRMNLPVSATVELISFDDEYFIAYQLADGAIEEAQSSAEWRCDVQQFDLESWYYGPVRSDGLGCERVGSTS